MKGKRDKPADFDQSIPTTVVLEGKRLIPAGVGEEKDLISELPDSLLHHILSFLDMIYVIQTSFLSRRWRYVWTSLTILNFDDKVYYDSCSSSSSSNGDNSYNFLNFVNRLLFFRDHKYNIQAFRISTTLESPPSDTYDSYYERGSAILPQIYTWIHVLVRLHNVQELDIQFKIPPQDDRCGIIRFPNCLFTCKTLKKLTLGVMDSGQDVSEDCLVFNLPVIMSLPALKTLHLKSFTYDTKNKRTKNFFSCCPVLETLIISNCRVKHLDEQLSISALQLKNLTIIDEKPWNPRNSSYEYGYSRIKVFAPKLTSFRCRDNKLNNYSLVDVSSLMNAEIETNHGSHYFEGYAYDTDDQRMTMKKRYTHNVVKCLRGITNVASLVLSTWLLEDVHNEVHKLGLESRLEAFPNLTFLKLRTSFSRDHYRVIKHFLVKCPNVETLVFEMTKPPESTDWGESSDCEELLSYGFKKCSKEKSDRCSKAKDESWKEFLTWQCELHHLKAVEIRNVSGSSNELKFLNFLLKDAVVLEKMVVYSSMKEAPNNFIEELVTFPRASSCTKIAFF